MVMIRSDQWQLMLQQEQQASSNQPPLPTQIIEPEPEAEEPLAVVVFDDHAKPSDDDDLELRPIKILRLFGVNIPIYHIHIDHHHHHDAAVAAAAAASTQQTQATIASHDHHHHDKRRKPSDDDDDRLPKKPKLLLDIPKIPTTSANPNIDHQQHVAEENKHDRAAPPPPPPAPPVEFDPRRLMVEGVTVAPVLLFTKELTDSDVVQQHNRLLVPARMCWALLAALTETERTTVLEIKEDYLTVVATAFNGRVEDEATEFTLGLTKWLSSRAVVLKKQWMQLVRANNLQCKDSVQAWGYRLRGQFRLAFNIIKKVELPN